MSTALNNGDKLELPEIKSEHILYKIIVILHCYIYDLFKI